MKNTFKLIIFCLGLLISNNLKGQNVQDSIRNTEKNKITVELKKEKESDFDKYFKYFTELLTPAIALLGILLTLPILRKKLLESHISKALIDIQDSNKNLLSETTDLIDEYVPKTHLNDIVRKEEIEAIFEKIKPIYKNSQDGNSDSQTMLFFLKYTLQNFLKHYDPSKHTALSTREIYGIVLNTLKHVVFFSTQVVQIPKSTKTNSENLINKKLKKYVSHSEFLKYRHFKQGLIDDPNSAHYLLFYAKINESTNSLLKRSAFQIFRSISPIKKMIYLQEIYAPIELNAPNVSPLFGGENHKLFLIGFKRSTSLTMEDGFTNKVVDLIYSNPDDFGRFASNLTFDRVCDDYKDVFIEKSGFKLEKASKMIPLDLETFSLQYDLDYLQKKFKENRRAFKKHLR